MSSTAALEQTAALAVAAEQVAKVPWDQVEDADLPVAAVELGRVKAMVDAALVSVAERLVETDAAADSGWASTKEFLTTITGGHKGAGGGLVRAAEQTAALPMVREALAAGAISLAQARVIAARVTTLPRVEELRHAAATKMLDLVKRYSYDATDLDRGFPDVIKDLDPDGTLLRADTDKPIAERGAHSARFLSFSPDTLGGVRIKGYATLEEVELVKTTLMPLAAPVTGEPGACGGDPTRLGQRDPQGRRIESGCPDPACGHDGKDPRESGARMWDALHAACRRLQATDTLPTSHGTTARIIVTTSIDTLRQQLHQTGHPGTGHAGTGLLPGGNTLSAAAVRRLACDAEIIPAVLGTHSQILDIGRTHRLITPALWVALVLRDQHCTFPGCTRLPIATHAHHIKHWADGGTTSLDNLLLLCARHHTLIHHTPWHVTIDPHTRRPVWRPPPPIDDRDRWTHRPAQHPPPLVA